MREGRASTTASFVSFARGVGLTAGSRDRLATDLVPAPFSTTLRGLEGMGRFEPLGRLAIRGITLGLIDHVGLRMLAIDRALSLGLDGGIEQLVLLGAGLDARAFRVDGLEEITVFEVDHPATQAYKRRRVGEREPRAREIRFVEVDFERERFGDRLIGEGFDPSRPTFWIWEGVTMYLPLPAIADGICEVGRVSAPGSHFAATYLLPGSLPFGRAGERLLHRVFGDVFGESLVGEIDPPRMGALLAEAGFEVEDDSGSVEWARRAERRSMMPAFFRGERLSHSIRKG